MKHLGAFRMPVIAGDAASPADGDIWYNSSTGKFRKRQNGSTTDLDTTGGSGNAPVEVTGTSQSMSVNTDYIANNAGLVTLTVPTVAAVGDKVRIIGKGAGGWKVAQNASGIIHFGNLDSTTGTGGHIDSTHKYDCVELMCIVANNEWIVVTVVGNLTVV
jgi:hypothetical protein